MAVATGKITGQTATGGLGSNSATRMAGFSNLAGVGTFGADADVIFKSDKASFAGSGTFGADSTILSSTSQALTVSTQKRKTLR